GHRSGQTAGPRDDRRGKRAAEDRRPARTGRARSGLPGRPRGAPRGGTGPATPARIHDVRGPRYCGRAGDGSGRGRARRLLLRADVPPGQSRGAPNPGRRERVVDAPHRDHSCSSDRPRRATEGEGGAGRDLPRVRGRPPLLQDPRSPRHERRAPGRRRGAPAGGRLTVRPVTIEPPNRRCCPVEPGACPRDHRGWSARMKPRITVITLGVADLDRAVRFYRDGLGLSTPGIVGAEFEHGAVAFFDLEGGLRLALWPRASIAHDTGTRPDGRTRPSSPSGTTCPRSARSTQSW